jgi:Novel toxin 21
VAHAAIGCVASGVQGGSCGAGAASAGFAAFAGPVINTGNFGADLAGHAVAGGLGSMAAGGKFGNGAVTGAFGYLFNYCGQGKCDSEFEQFLYDYWPGYKFGTGAYNGVVNGQMASGGEIADVVSLFPGGSQAARMVKGMAKGAPQNERGLVFKTSKEAATAAKDLGFEPTGKRSHGQEVFRKGNTYITRDVDGHNGGAWKVASSIKDLGMRETRSGTYSADLKIRIGN